MMMAGLAEASRNSSNRIGGMVPVSVTALQNCSLHLHQDVDRQKNKVGGPAQNQ
jgi:hypothetical protein